MRKGQVYFLLDESAQRGEEATYPRVDLFLTKDEVFLLAEVPGVSREMLEVKIDKGFIEIRGIRREPESCSNATQFYKLESFYGSFERRISMPCEVDTNAASVSLKDGVLEIMIPKHLPRVIEIPVE